LSGRPAIACVLTCFLQKKLDAVTNVGRAEVARLKDLNSQAKQDAKELNEKLEAVAAELEGARARIAELEAAVAAASAASTAAPAPQPKSSVSEDSRAASADSVSAAAAAGASQEEEAAPRVNAFQSLGDIGLGEAASQLVAHVGEHGYAIIFGADSAEGEPSARTQLVESAAAAVTAAGVAVAVHKIDISGLNDGSAFVVPGEDGADVRASPPTFPLNPPFICSAFVLTCARTGRRPLRRQPATTCCSRCSRPCISDLAAPRRQQRHGDAGEPEGIRVFESHGSDADGRHQPAAQPASHCGDGGRGELATALLVDQDMSLAREFAARRESSSSSPCI